jgi:ribosomal protein L4
LKLGLKMALSAKIAQNRVVILNEFPKFETANSEELANLLKVLNSEGQVQSSSTELILSKNPAYLSAVVVPGENIEENLYEASLGIDQVDLLRPKKLNVYDLLRCKYFVTTQEVIKQLEEKLSR